MSDKKQDGGNGQLYRRSKAGDFEMDKSLVFVLGKSMPMFA